MPLLERKCIKACWLPDWKVWALLTVCTMQARVCVALPCLTARCPSGPWGGLAARERLLPVDEWLAAGFQTSLLLTDCEVLGGRL